MSPLMRALIWAVCLPLLAPQGMCRCAAYMPQSGNPTSTVSVTKQAQTKERTACSCHVENVSKKSDPTPQRIPAQKCSKCLGNDQTRWVEPPAKLEETKRAGILAVEVISNQVIVISKAHNAFSNERHDVSNLTPRYISFCALLI